MTGRSLRPFPVRWPTTARRRARPASPFAVLGLDPAGSVSDDDVRAAWRRLAAATHPDRADGGDPARFASAAAAYTDLRTATGRNEARAEQPGRPSSRLGRLLLRAALAVAASGGLVLAAPGPASAGLVVGIATWLALASYREFR